MLQSDSEAERCVMSCWKRHQEKRKAHVLLNVISYMFCCSQWSKDARQTV